VQEAIVEAAMTALQVVSEDGEEKEREKVVNTEIMRPLPKK
jgi:hypothetical protein